MENENRKCFRCKYLDRYYTKGVKRFNKTKCGWCSIKISDVNIHETCDKFVSDTKSYRSKGLIKINLNNFLTELSELRKLLECELDDNEDM